MKQRQSIVEEKINNLFKGMSKLSTTMQGAEAMNQDLQERVGILESSNSKVWERFDTDDQRLNRLESSINGLDTKLDEKVEMIQEWFVNMSSQDPTDSSRHITESLRGIVVDLSDQVVNNSM